MNSLIRKIVSIPRFVPGYVGWIRSRRARSAAIVMYHGVAGVAPNVPNWCLLDERSFQDQVEFLALNYRVLPLRELISRLAQGRSLPERLACLTFDDAYRNVATTALPHLARHQLPATVFVVTQLAESGRPPWTGELYDLIVKTQLEGIDFNNKFYGLVGSAQKQFAQADIGNTLKAMSDEHRRASIDALRSSLIPDSPCHGASPLATLDWADIEKLARSSDLFDFGSHTHTHPILSRCSPEKQREELFRSRDLLLEHLGNADLLAYPNGGRNDFNQLTKSIAREVGYRCGLSTIPGLTDSGDDLFELRRVHVGADCDLRSFERHMVGLH